LVLLVSGTNFWTGRGLVWRREIVVDGRRSDYAGVRDLRLTRRGGQWAVCIRESIFGQMGDEMVLVDATDVDGCWKTRVVSAWLLWSFFDGLSPSQKWAEELNGKWPKHRPPRILKRLQPITEKN
jgi:hypothetical protein